MERQEEELQVLQAIYMDDFRDLRKKVNKLLILAFKQIYVLFIVLFKLFCINNSYTLINFNDSLDNLQTQK